MGGRSRCTEKTLQMLDFSFSMTFAEVHDTGLVRTLGFHSGKEWSSGR